MEAGIEADDVRRRERTCGVCGENAGAKSKQFRIHCFPLNLPCILMPALDMRHGGGGGGGGGGGAHTERCPEIYS